MKSPNMVKPEKLGENGFTLVELLIVLLILSVLAAVAILNINTAFSQGYEQAWNTDLKSIHGAVVLFYFDEHTGPDNKGTGHWYPTSDGYPGTGTASHGDAVAADSVGDGKAFQPIYMGLMTNTPGTFSWTKDGAVAFGEQGPYLNEIPQSASADNSERGTGTYTWVLGAGGRVFGLYSNGSDYICGFGKAYP